MDDLKKIQSAILLVFLVLTVGACGTPEAGSEEAVSSRIEIDLDKADPERLLRYYFGGYVGPDGGDPFETGLLTAEAGRFYIDVTALETGHPGLGTSLGEAAGDRRLDWDELAGFLNVSYYTARNLPSTLDAFRAETPYGDAEASWFHVELDGVMSTARRHVYIAEDALRAALRGYQAQDGQLFYPVGTVIVGEHRLSGVHVETTVMRKRSDGFWDFFTYGPDSTLAAQTQALPRALKTPTQCVGCHFGAKLFEPERSFPAAASPGPHGPRAFYIDEALRDREVVVFFDEHRKRSDTVLGIYNTLFVARLRADRRAGHLDEDDGRLLETLGL